MDFSESYRATGTPIHSPNGQYLATAVEYRLIIREVSLDGVYASLQIEASPTWGRLPLNVVQVETLRVVQLYACLDQIECLEWAENSLYVLCGLYSRAIIQARLTNALTHVLVCHGIQMHTHIHTHWLILQVWAVDQPDWTCKIDEGPAGICKTMWAPGGLSLVCVASFQIRCIPAALPRSPYMSVDFSYDSSKGKQRKASTTATQLLLLLLLQDNHLVARG